MKNKILTLICVLIVMCLALTLGGCAGTKSANQNGEKSVSSGQNRGNKEQDSANETDVPELDTDESDESDEDFDEDFDDDFDEDYYEEDDKGVAEIGVHNKSVVNDNFMGIGGIYNLWVGLEDNQGRVYTEAQRQTEFDRVAAMGVKTIRSYYGSGLTWDGATQTFDFNKPNYLKYIDNCKEMEKRGIDILITAQWSLNGLTGATPSDMTEDGQPNVGKAYGLYVQDDFEASCNNLRNFMKESVLQFKARGVNNIKYIIPFTEPHNSSLFRPEGTYENVYSEEGLADFNTAFTAVHNGLKDAGLRDHYKLVGPGDARNLERGWTAFNENSITALKGIVDIFGTHADYPRANEYINDDFAYNTAAFYEKEIPAVKSKGLQYWIDEYNVNIHNLTDALEQRSWNQNPWKGTAWASVTSTQINLGANNMFIWSLVDDQFINGGNTQPEFYNGMQMTGCAPSLFNSYTPYPLYYAVSLFGNYLGTGKAYKCDEHFCVYSNFVKRDDGNVTYAAVNYDVTDTKVHITFDESLEGKTLYRRVYIPASITPTSSAKMIQVSAKAVNVTTGFYDTLPGGAIAVYTTVKD